MMIVIGLVCFTNPEDDHRWVLEDQVAHHHRNNLHSSTRSTQSSRDQHSYPEKKVNDDALILLGNSALY